MTGHEGALIEGLRNVAYSNIVVNGISNIQRLDGLNLVHHYRRVRALRARIAQHSEQQAALNSVEAAPEAQKGQFVRVFDELMSVWARARAVTDQIVQGDAVEPGQTANSVAPGQVVAAFNAGQVRAGNADADGDLGLSDPSAGA